MKKPIKKPTKKLLKKSTEETKVVTKEVNYDEETFELLAGYVDSDGVVHKEFSFRDITGEDEELIHQGKNSKDGTKVTQILLSRCTKHIGSINRKDLDNEQWNKIFKDMLGGDLDYMMFKLREQSLGKEIKTSHKCPNCEATLNTIMDISEIEIIPFKGERSIKFELPKEYKDAKGNVYKYGSMRLPNGLDRQILIPIAIKNVAKGTTTMLSRISTFNNEDGNSLFMSADVMNKFSSLNRKYLNEILVDNYFGPKLVVPVTCTECGEEFVGALNTTNFI